MVPLGLLPLLLRPAVAFLAGVDFFILVLLLLLLLLLLCLFFVPLEDFVFALLVFGSSVTLGFLAFYAILAIAA